jgi:hypothetical protein
VLAISFIEATAKVVVFEFFILTYPRKEYALKLFRTINKTVKSVCFIAAKTKKGISQMRKTRVCDVMFCRRI